MSVNNSNSQASVGGGDLGAHNDFAAVFGDEEENPFKLPSDELIFTFNENEKDRKVIEREKNK